VSKDLKPRGGNSVLEFSISFKLEESRGDKKNRILPPNIFARKKTVHFLECAFILLQRCVIL